MSPSDKPRWYVVHVYSGSERRVAETIREQAEKKNLKEKILDVLVPVEEVIEIKKGEKLSSEKSFFPGYVLVHMVMSDETWHLIKSTAKVTGFLGGKGKPSPISESEVTRLLSQVQERQSKPKHTLRFEVGEQVRVSDGPFASFNGIVEDIDEEKERLKVSVSIFGRATPVDLDYTQVEKV
ncbi:transcription termination/antitermination protein NusG [Candidatus Nucleicultrix amoebiphila]|jgi:transcriptional antiterminator NusG|uniref:Transcription termination/antitermination protein NusG n=1 Tax=Candidatus Nucleicultrix amoebiphila FS5 TaxID=1414854 RepID=A0A1W6N646_9PROT|nr:transcription termination/antitermination protein NusG [Candidatus Nucleicultrix amoebiphila]ARN85311.1 antitermination protein NusG [Candidatus Nucleicultrix amoebiphila FS5]